MYTILAIITSCLAIFYEKKLQLKSPFISALFILFLVIFIGFKFEIGTDWELIYSNFIRLTSGEDMNWTSSPLYLLLSLCSFRLGLSIYGVNIACAVLFSFGLYSLLIRLSRPWLALSVFYPYYILVFSLNFDRQSAALGLAMLGISQLLDSRKIRYISLVILGALFHPTVLILLPLFFVTESITSKRYLFFVSASCVIILSTMSIYYAFILGNINSLFANYFDSGYIFASQGLWFRLLPLLFSAGFILFFHREVLQLTKLQHSIYTLMSLLVISLSLASLQFPLASTVIDRLSAYAAPLLLFSASESPNVLKHIGVPSVLVVSLLSAYSLAVTVAWLTFSYYASNYWIPYQTILFK